jgi:hypothetical protein
MRRCWFLVPAVLVLATTSAQARTITLTAADCDQMAILSARSPRLSWAGIQPLTGVFYTYPSMQLFPDMALLLRFPLDKIPKGQRITKAELFISPDYVAGTPRVSVRRLLADWGPGVCHDYCRTVPKKVKWAEPGGRGAGTDRTAKDSSSIRMDKVAEYSADVTEDVELWYTGATANRGWILMIDNDSGPFYAATPYGGDENSSKRWKLQITFEAE